MEKVRVTDTFLKKMKIKDLNNRDFEIKDKLSKADPSHNGWNPGTQ